MKKIRMALIAAVVVLSASAFTKGHLSKPPADSMLWHLKAGATNPDVAANYELASTAGSYTCGGNDQICEITDVADSGNPSQPALSFGAPSTDPTDYDATFRPE